MDRLEETQNMFNKLKSDMPKELSSFINFTQLAKSEGAIDKKSKDLILVSLAVASQCSWCIALHIDAAVKSGATKDEILEACMLSVVMGGGPKLMYMNIVYEELEKHFNSRA